MKFVAPSNEYKFYRLEAISSNLATFCSNRASNSVLFLGIWSCKLYHGYLLSVNARLQCASCNVQCAMCSKCCLISSKSKDIEIRFTVIYTMSVQMSTTTTHTKKKLLYMHKWIFYMTLLDVLHRMNIRESSHISSKYGWMFPGKMQKKNYHISIWKIVNSNGKCYQYVCHTWAWTMMIHLHIQKKITHSIRMNRENVSFSVYHSSFICELFALKCKKNAELVKKNVIFWCVWSLLHFGPFYVDNLVCNSD